MQFRHTITVDAPPDRVWDFLWDVDRLAQCIPGCEEATTIEPHVHYKALIADRVGPLKLKMPLDLVIKSAEEGQRLHVVGTGKDSALGSNVQVDIQTTLAAEGAGSVVDLTVDAVVSGKIAGLGAGLFRRKFDDIMSQFGSRLKAAIEGSQQSVPAGS